MNGGMVRPRAFAVFKLTTSSCTALAPSVIEPPPYTAQVARRSRRDRPAEADSPVEERRFELPVPLATVSLDSRGGEGLQVDQGCLKRRHCFSRGTSSSNPPCSTGESCRNSAGCRESGARRRPNADPLS